MARNLGTFAAPFNFKVTMQEAFDPRVVVGTKAELITKATWPADGDTLYLYNGLLVGVVDERAVYMLIDIDKALDADYSGWLRVDAGNAEQVEVVDNLESDSSVAALSAKQGKVLMGEIAGVKAKLVNIYTYKGSKDTYEELPTDAVAGDVWNVKAAYGTNPAGTNYAWVVDLTEGGHWDALGGSLDLSNYFTKSEVEAAIKVESDRADAEEKRLAGLINTNAQAIAEVKGDVSAQTTSIGQLSAALSATNEEVSKKVDAVEGSSLIPAAKLELIDASASAISQLQQTDTDLDTRLKTIESAFSGEGGTIDLGDITASLGDHSTRLVALETNSATKTELSTLQTQVNGHGDRLTAIETLNTEQSGHISGLTTRVEAVEKHGEAISNLTLTVNGHTQEISDIKSSISGLAVKSVADGEKVLQASEAGALSTVIALGYDSTTRKIQLKGIADTVVSELDATAFIQDGMLDKAEYDTATKELVLTWNTQAGKNTMRVPLGALVDTYTAGNGLTVVNNQFSARVSTSENNRLTLAEDGSLLVDISEDVAAIENSINVKISAALAWEDVK